MSSTDSFQSEKVVSSVSAALKAVWWIPLVRGIMLVIMGMLLMMEPLTTLTTVIWVFGAFLFIDGIIAVAQGFANRDQSGWKWWLVQGVLDVVFAVIIMVWPGITGIALLYVLLVWTIALGVTAIIGATAMLRNKDLGWPWMLAFGVLSVLFGVIVLARGLGGFPALTLVTIIFGIYAAVMGVVQIVSAFSVRSTARDIDEALRGNSAVLEAIIERRVAKAQEDAARAASAETEKAAAQAEKAADKAEKDAEKAAGHAAKDRHKQGEQSQERARVAANLQQDAVRAAAQAQQDAEWVATQTTADIMPPNPRNQK